MRGLVAHSVGTLREPLWGPCENAFGNSFGNTCGNPCGSTCRDLVTDHVENY